ncbi:MAG: DNA polymerase III subunit delta [Gammaproteobacteria bacterium]|nr:DNA polymerase III subunit delta [Gammaproteobacteria bacterium]
MRVYPEKLQQQLDAGLSPVYLVSGDEPFQTGECCDAIRAAARAAGFTTREVLEAGSGFDWQQLTAEAAAFSLFADKKVIDLRIPGGKPGAEGSRALVAYCDDPPPDTLLLITLPKLDRTQQNAKWFKAIDGLGATLQIWPIEVARLPAWIDGRLRAAGIIPTREAVQMLADRVEGNLLAAHQEIEKLLLLQGEGPLDAEQLASAVADSARYDVFELVDSALRGEAARVVHILDGLRAEGTAAAVVLWALHRETHTMAGMAADIAKGLSVEHAISRARVFNKRIALVRQALGRLRTPQWLALLDVCQQADAAIKGTNRQQPWILLEQLALGMSGQTGLPAH